MRIPHTAPAVVCHHVLHGTHPVLLVTKLPGERWSFLCGGLHRGMDEYGVICIGHILEKDSSLTEVMDLPDNWDAERADVTSAWRRMPSSENG